MNAEERTIYIERITSLYAEVEKSFEIIDDGIAITLNAISREDPDLITRMNLLCDIYMADKLMEQLKTLRDELEDIRGGFCDEDDNAE